MSAFWYCVDMLAAAVALTGGAVKLVEGDVAAGAACLGVGWVILNNVRLRRIEHKLGTDKVPWEGH